MTPPADVEELMERACRLAGRRLDALAESVSVPVPNDLRRHKGWVGTLLETVLGADAGSEARPDFPHLGIELKTLPIDRRGRPRESTWVCTAPLDGRLSATWEGSWVRAKLACVLWIPVQAGAETPLAERRVAMPLLWSPAPAEEATLREDWEEITEALRLGQVEEVDARRGTALQLRPKAANARVERWTLGADASWVLANPRGFYLRTSFTAALLQRHFVLPGA